jgi:hypothetical protein
MPPSTDFHVPSTAPLPATFDLLGRAPLIPGDNTSGYDTLLARISGAVRPADVLEQAWVRDVVDLLWEAVRLRRLKAALMTACADQGMQKLLAGLDVEDSYDLSKRWAARELEAVGEVEAILAAAGLTIDHVMAQTLRLRIAEVERIDRMIASAEARRAAALREVAYHREHFAAGLRRAAQETENIGAANIQDAEFEVVAPPIAQAAMNEPAQVSRASVAEAAA